IDRTVKPFARARPELVSQADIQPVKPRATGGAALGTSTSHKSSACGSFALAYDQEICLQKEGQAAREGILDAERNVQSLTGATEVALFGYPEPSGQRAKPVEVSTGVEVEEIDPHDDVVDAFHNKGRPVYSFGTIGDTQYARAALPFTTPVKGGSPDHW